MLLSYKNVEIRQNNVPILRDVNFSFDVSDFVFITGKVGSGKSTLLSTIYGELVPTAGNAQVLGYDMLNIKQKQITSLRKQLGIIFQSFELLTDRSVYSNLEFVLKATGWKNKAEINSRIQDVLSKAELLDRADDFPLELSGGEQQRIAIARALLNTPKIIIADEPTGNLDAESTKAIMKLLNEIRVAGTAVIMSTHNLQLIDSVDSAQVYRCADKQLEKIS